MNCPVDKDKLFKKMICAQKSTFLSLGPSAECPFENTRQITLHSKDEIEFERSPSCPYHNFEMDILRADAKS